MRLHKLSVKGFRKLNDVTIHFGDATWLLGQNNCGKSSALKAIEYLLSGLRRVPEAEWYSEIDDETGEPKVCVSKIEMEAEFRNVPVEAENWRGFKGRVFDCDVVSEGDTGKAIFYKKIYPIGKDVEIYMKSRKRQMKPEYVACRTPQSFIDAGIGADIIGDLFDKLDVAIPAKEKDKLFLINDLYELEDEVEWDCNPGGIAGVVLSRLPRFLLIPASTSSSEITTTGGVLQKTLNELFSDVRDTSKNYKAAQEALNALAKEMNPDDSESEFGKLMSQLNVVLANVFPNSAINAKADLSDPDTALKPSFDITMTSNVRTPVELQGTGMVRSAVFALLRYRQHWLSAREDKEDRSIIIGFEEPEIYLHPSAANQMRNVIYELSSGTSQIVATTHSPFMIDLSRKPRQVLNKFGSGEKFSVCSAFNVSDAFKALQADDKAFVKMVLKVDDYMARAFFTKFVVIVEGDTEDIVIRQSLLRMQKAYKEHYLKIVSDFEILKARGKAAIISLSKYLRSMGIEIFVIHDRDGGTDGAAVMNDPIKDAVGDASRVVVLEECIEDVLGYVPPSSEKPYKAFKHSEGWGDDWEHVPEALRAVLGKVFVGYLPEVGAAEVLVES